MTPLSRLASLASFTLLLLTPGLAQESHLRRESPDKTKSHPEVTLAEPTASAAFPFRPMRSWMGERFVFLPKPKLLPPDAPYEDFNGKVTLRKYVGRIAQVTSVSESAGWVYLEFEMEDDGARLRARTFPYKESIKGLVRLDDLNQARAVWAGQTLWSREGRIFTYDEQADIVSALSIKRCAPVKVTDVVAGWDEEKPIRLLLQTAGGEQGFVDVNLSGTNVPKEARHLHRLEDAFFTRDPRASHKWPAAVWAAVEGNQVFTGMTAEQVRFSWGEPDKVTKTAAGKSQVEHWIYANAGTLAFKNGVLIGIQ